MCACSTCMRMWECTYMWGSVHVQVQECACIPTGKRQKPNVLHRSHTCCEIVWVLMRCDGITTSFSLRFLLRSPIVVMKLLGNSTANLLGFRHSPVDMPVCSTYGNARDWLSTCGGVRAKIDRRMTKPNFVIDQCLTWDSLVCSLCKQTWLEIPICQEVFVHGWYIFHCSKEIFSCTFLQSNWYSPNQLWAELHVPLL